MQLPLGLASITRNARYTAQSVGTRYGLSTRLKVSPANPVTALGAIRFLSPAATNAEIIEMLAYTSNDGNLSSMMPFQQNTLTQLTTNAFLAQANLTRVPGASPVIAQAFNRGMIAMGNLINGVAPGLIYDPETGTIDPISDLPFAAPWTPGTTYRVGQVVSPSTYTTFGITDAPGEWIEQQTGFVYQCTTPGTSGVAAHQPAWPTTFGATVGDNGIVWKECTPTIVAGMPDPAAPTNPTTAVNAASPITAGATVYLACTYVNAQGEGINELVVPLGNNAGTLDPSRMLTWNNTTSGPVNLTVTLPTIPVEFGVAGPLGANFGATGINLYAFIVQGTPDPEQIIDPSFYAQLAGGPFASGANVTLSGYTNGQELPVVNTAVLSLTAGNVDTGVRFMVTLFETRTDYQTGWSNSAPVRINVTQSGQQLTLLRGPIGPYNCEARVFAFTLAGASSAGPYTYVDQADVESPGFNQPQIAITATRIADNVTTSTMFNFTDTYLPGASDVTNYADRIQIPPFVDAYFSKTLQSVVYTGVNGYQSSHLVSDLGDPEAIRIPGSNINVSANDGDRTIAWREVRGIQISLKENAGYAVMTNDGDPSTWDPQELWTGFGPVGAKAVDVSAEDEGQFMVFAHRTGLYLYEGGAPKLISRELLTDWDTINWACGQLIVVKIDEKRREIRISAPANGSTTCNTVFTLNYFFGMSDPVVFVQRRGILVPNVEGRKWSIDDISASDILYVPQRSASATQQAGVDITNNMIFASTDGSLKTVTDKQYHDQDYNGNPIGYFAQWVCVPGTQNPTEAIMGLAGATCSAIGNGLINVYAVDDTGATHPLSGVSRTWQLKATESQRDFGTVSVEACRFGIGFDNGGVADAWWEMHTAALWIFKKWGSRPG
ncbi:MAG: hypothetical protein ACLQLH_03490 [Terracidiphilus sp.]